MTKPINIVVIGTGNVAQHVANSFQGIDSIHLVQIFNHRATPEAKQFSKRFQCSLETNYSKINTNANVYIIAVKDDAIAELVKKITPLNLKGIVVHTSGSTDIKALKMASKNTGVYYPLQTFYKGAQINWKTTPVLIEGNSKSVETKLKLFAGLVSNKVKVVKSKSRLQMHLAAVFACNFTNAMYVSAFQIIEKNIGKKDTDLLLPIMQHSFQKLQNIHPKQAQTGPAMRGDKLVMKKHLELIKNNKQLTQVYKILSELIVSQQYSK